MHVCCVDCISNVIETASICHGKLVDTLNLSEVAAIIRSAGCVCALWITLKLPGSGQS